MDKKSFKKMTAAQKKAQARFKAAVSEAKKLRKKNPRMSQPEALKQAFAIEYKKERSGKRIAGPAKKAAKKAAPKKAAKKCAPKKAARKTAKPGERHTDTKSHNVNIRVMSGPPSLQYVLWGVKISAPDWDESILYESNKPITITEALKKLAAEKGYNRLRVAKIDMQSKPDFLQTIRGVKNTTIKGIPHKSKYYIRYRPENGEEKIEYFPKYPANYYRANDGYLYVMRMTKNGSSLVPIKNVKTDKTIKK